MNIQNLIKLVMYKGSSCNYILTLHSKLGKCAKETARKMQLPPFLEWESPTHSLSPVRGAVYIFSFLFLRRKFVTLFILILGKGGRGPINIERVASPSLISATLYQFFVEFSLSFSSYIVIISTVLCFIINCFLEWFFSHGQGGGHANLRLFLLEIVWCRCV